jgi:CelD/BcsL family acetyltransferase involved in cellulose biosynthesis
MSLTVTRLAGLDAVARVAAEWEALDCRSAPRTPFSSPLWNALWWKHYRKHGLFTDDEFLVHIVRSADGKLVAVAPLFSRSVPGIGPLRCRMIQFFGADPSITELRRIVCAPEDQAAVLETLHRYFQRDFQKWDLFRWDGIDGGLPPNVVDPEGSRPDAIAQLPNYFIVLPGTWSELQSRLSAKFRRNMRKRYEFLARDGHVFKFHVIDSQSKIDQSLETFFRLHALRAQFDAMDVKHPNRFADRVNREFLSEYTREMSARGGSRIFELEIGGRIIASQLAFAVGKDLWLYSSGFDPEWRKYGVMTMLTAEILQWSILAQFKIVNLSCGQDLGKLRWQPTEIIFSHYFQRAPGVRGHLIMRAWETADALRHAAAWLRGFRPGRGRNGGEANPDLDAPQKSMP